MSDTEYYVGHPCKTDHIPFRIGEGFRAGTITEARRKAAEVLSGTNFDVGYLCIVRGTTVEVRGCVSRDGTYSRYVIKDDRMPVMGDRSFEWKRIPKKG